MLTITGTAHRAFVFPADPQTTLAYYFHLERIVAYLPHITLLTTHDPNHITLMYQSEELQAYTITIHCDLLATISDNGRSMLVRPVPPQKPIAAEATLTQTRGPGHFTMDAHFSESPSGHTHIDYTLQLEAKLPRPRGMRLMPRRIVNRLAAQITNGRITEIADGFIEQTIAAYPAWQATYQSD